MNDSAISSTISFVGGVKRRCRPRLPAKRKLATSNSSRGSAGFTLIELLAVMLIMAIITGITVVAFTGLTRGAAISGAGRNVQATIKLARQYAIANRIPVAFVVCDPDFIAANGLTLSEENRELIGRSYAVYDLKNYKYLKAWTQLPQGTVFAIGNPEDLDVAIPHGKHVLSGVRSHSEMNVLDYDIPFPAEYSDDYTTCFGITFEPDGKIRKSGSNWYLWLFVFEGAMVPDNGDYKAVLRGEGSAEASRITYGIKISYSGGTQMIEL